jgi:recombination protein RecA
VKNKVAAPFRTTEFDMLYGEGISKEGEALALGEKLGLVEKSSGGSYSIGETKLGRGYDAARTFLKENKPVLNQLFKDIRKGLQSGNVIAKSPVEHDE